MKRKKYLFNTLLLKYNKYKAKLLRFRLTGRNEHRQGVLEKHLDRLQVKLSNLLVKIKKGGAIVAVSTAIAIAPNLADAQITFAGDTSPLLFNPFGLTNTGVNRSNSNLVDIDGDGDLDLMSGDFYGDFHYFENTGTASNPIFSASQTNPFGLTGVGYYSISDLVDLDGDGDLDLMAGEYYGNFLYFENTGTASAPAFAAFQSNPFGLSNSALTNSSDLVDLDNDGDLDLMSGDLYGNFYYYENTGTTTAPAFAADSLNPFGLSAPAYAYRLTSNLVDVDGDGDLDLMSGDQYGDFYFFENTGTASAPAFAASQTNPFSLYYTYAMSTSDLVDLDNDGDLDLITGSSNGNFYYFNNSSGAADVLDFTIEFPIVNNPFGLNSYVSYTNSNLIDLDDDGDLDLMSGSNYGNFHYFENSGTASNPNFIGYSTNPFGLTSVGYYMNSDLVDLDGDGDLDLMAGDLYGSFTYFENTGTASAPAFALAVANPFSLSYSAYFASSNLVDLDNDGDIDLMSGSQYGNLIYFENTAGVGNTPVFSAGVADTFGLTNAGTVTVSDLVDLDGDGDLDLMTGDIDGNFHYFENTGTPSAPAFAAAQTNIFGLINTGIYFGSSDLVDLDGDGDLDLMSGSNFSGFYYYENITCDVHPLTATLDSSTDIVCNGDDNGTIEVNASGLSPYAFSIDNDATTQATGSFDNLAPGTYPISIQDANQCKVSLTSVVIAEPDSIAISSFTPTIESSPGAADGVITVVSEGGTGALDISWVPSGASGATATGLSAGNQTVTITDDNNCSFTQTIVLDMPSSINSLEVKDLAVYPNPTTGFITVSFEAMEMKDVQFNILNTIGKTVLQETILAVNGSFTKSFNLSNLATGVYLLQINSGEGTVTKKITVSK